MGKSMAGGVPMGAVAIGPRVQGLKPGTHGSTFGGNPLACAASAATIRIMLDERLPERAAAVGARMLARLSALRAPVIREVRGAGLLLGIELRDRVRPVLAALQEQGVLALPAGATTLRLLPPLVIDDTQVEQVLTAIEETLSTWQPARQETAHA
jgi:acetylornithine/LysW-gamma-L-lysine aminotransferase